MKPIVMFGKPLLFSMKILPADIQAELRSSRSRVNHRVLRACAPAVTCLALCVYVFTFLVPTQFQVHHRPWILANILSLGISSAAMSVYAWARRRAAPGGNAAFLVYGLLLILCCCSFALWNFVADEDLSALVAGTFAVSFLIGAPNAFYIATDLAAGAIFCLGLAALKPGLATIDHMGMALAYCVLAILISLVLESQRGFAAYTRILLSRANVELRQLAVTDHLTGAVNRRFFEEMLKKSIDLSARTGRPLSLLFIDLDRFKSINDDFGHEAGDRALKATVDTVSADLRESDVISRFGGEEFCVMLPDTGEGAASEIAERLRSRREVSVIEGIDRALTMSLGVATLAPGDDAKSLVAKADRALYQAKARGRNCWVFAG